MDASIDHDGPMKAPAPGRFTRVSVQTPAGEIEARLSEKGTWELRVRRDEETSWRLACSGDLDCGMMVAQPVSKEVLTRGPLAVDPDARRAMVGDTNLDLRGKSSPYSLFSPRSPIGSSRRRSCSQRSGAMSRTRFDGDRFSWIQSS